ncbi:hypothetical protein TNCV_3659501 [Trichonephila clavipes]|nr:hypothetical protein TNCV_3659501 [Trichonephila clavipes]
MITNFFIPELNNHDVQELWFQQDGATCHTARATIDLLKDTLGDRLISRFGPVNLQDLLTATAGSDVVQSGRPIFDDFFQHLWPYIGNNTANVVFQMVKRLWLIRIDQ